MFSSEHQELLEKQADRKEFFLRVLRATMKDKNGKRIFQADQAFERCVKILEFKKKNNVWQEPEKIGIYRKAYPRLAYFDPKIKRIVNISRFGEFASTAKMSRLSEEDWSRCMGYEMERTEGKMIELAKETGVDTQGYIGIADASNLTLSILKRTKIVKFLANVSGYNYPEMIGVVYLVNAPWIFSKIFKIFSPILDAQTVQKFRISSGIPEEFKDIFDLSRLPKEYGGERDIVVAYPMESKLFDEDLLQPNIVD